MFANENCHLHLFGNASYNVRITSLLILLLSSVMKHFQMIFFCFFSVFLVKLSPFTLFRKVMHSIKEIFCYLSVGCQLFLFVLVERLIFPFDSISHCMCLAWEDLVNSADTQVNKAKGNNRVVDIRFSEGRSEVFHIATDFVKVDLLLSSFLRKFTQQQLESLPDVYVGWRG